MNQAAADQWEKLAAARKIELDKWAKLSGTQLAEVVNLRQQVADLEKSHANAAKAQHEAENLANQAAVATDLLTKSRDELDRLCREASQAANRYADQYRREQEETASLRQRLKLETQRAGGTVENLRAAVAELGEANKEVTELRAKVVAEQEAYTAARDTAEDRRLQIVDLVAASQKQEKAIGSQKKEIARLVDIADERLGSIKQLKDLLAAADLRIDLLENSQVTQQTHEAVAKLACDRLQTLEHWKGKAETLAGKLEDVLANFAKQVERAEAAEQRIDELIGTEDEYMQALRARVEELTTENGDLTAKLSALEDRWREREGWDKQEAKSHTEVLKRLAQAESALKAETLRANNLAVANIGLIDAHAKQGRRVKELLDTTDRAVQERDRAWQTEGQQRVACARLEVEKGTLEMELRDAREYNQVNTDELAVLQQRADALAKAVPPLQEGLARWQKRTLRISWAIILVVFAMAACLYIRFFAFLRGV